MDIYILHEGQESGPYSEKAVSQLLEQGGIVPGDLAWRSGLSEWLPVSEVLATQPMTAPPAVAPKRPAEKTQLIAKVDKAETVDKAEKTDKADVADKATAKQKALLSFLRIVFPADLSRDQASRLVNDAMEDPSNAERLTLWNTERFRLHPDLFAAEIQAKKENRANHFFELCQTAGADYFQGITKAHCQVLVSFLDVKFPHWDARESEAADHYFYPAVAEKFPQLVQKQWRGRLHYNEGHKVASEMVRKSAAIKSRSTSTSALAAVTRGLVLGLVILGVLYFGYRAMQQDLTAAPTANGAAMPVETSPVTAPLQTTAPSSAPAETAAPAVASTAPGPDAAPPAPLTAPIPAPAEAVATTIPGIAAATTVPEPALPVADPSGPPPAAAANPAPPMAADATPPMATVPPAAGVPPAATTDPSGMAPNSTAVNTAPMATLPNGEPPVPVPPPPATMPVAGTLPTLPPEAFTIPPLPPTADPAATPATPATSPIPAVTGPVVKTQLLLMKPVEIQLAYGKIMLPPGTAVKLVSRQGGILKVSYRDSVISVPASSTDID